MSDTNPENNPLNLANGLRPETLLRYTDERYSAATWEDVRDFMRLTELTGSRAGEIVGVSARKIRRWLCAPGSEDYQPIPYAVWRLLLLETGFVTLD
jgi:hypothetical protein